MKLDEAIAEERQVMSRLIDGKATTTELVEAQKAVRDARAAADARHPKTLEQALTERYTATTS